MQQNNQNSNKDRLSDQVDSPHDREELDELCHQLGALEGIKKVERLEGKEER